MNTPLPYGPGVTPKSLRVWDSPAFQTPSHYTDQSFTPAHKS